MALEITCKYCPKHAERQQSDKLPTECTLSNGAPCQACARHLELKAQIEETKKLLDKLIADEHQARIDINQFHDPSHRLPVEITSYIFGFTLPEFRLIRQEQQVYWPYSTQWERTESETGVLTLGAVCQLWRNIAWSTPQLWSNVTLRISKEPTGSMTHVIEEWLKRSGELPLSIRLFIGESAFGRDDDGVIEHDDRSIYMSFETFRLLDLIDGYSARWQNFCVQCTDDVVEYFGRSSELNRLKALQLLIVYQMNRHEPVFSAYKRATTQLEHVVATGINKLRNIDVSWNNATNVTVDLLSVPDCIRLLQMAPKLIDLRLEDIQEGLSRFSDATAQQTPQTFPDLQTLYISAKCSFGTLLDIITLPSLNKLHIYAMYHGLTRNLLQISLTEFLERSSCSLETFVLDSNGCEEQEIIPIINSLPCSLKNLHLDIQLPRYYVEERDPNLLLLFNHLSRTPSTASGVVSPSALLPNLETFKFHVNETTQIPWEPLLRIPRPIFGGVRPFKELSIAQRIRVNAREAFEAHGNPRLPFIITKSQNVDKSIMRQLIDLQEVGIDLYLPHKVPRQDLLELLQEK